MLLTGGPDVCDLPPVMKATTYKTSLRGIFTPATDKFTGGKYQGNHRDFVASFTREGDKLTVDVGWIRDAGSMLVFRDSKVYSISTMLEGLKETADECGLTFECIDDIPEGFSHASMPTT